MTVSEAVTLRASWMKSGNPPCPHPKIDTEHTLTGQQTGGYVCMICGCRFNELNKQ